MAFFDRAEEAAAVILKAFSDPNCLPEPLARLFLKRREKVPCHSWSWRNQVIVLLHGTSDARGYKQWQKVGRTVKQGERAFRIMVPITRKRIDNEGEGRLVVIGFRGVPVFGVEQTQGDPLPTADPEDENWVESLPLLDVAQSWGLAVETFDGETATNLGFYRRREEIGLGVKNLSTWSHELIHAAEDRLGKLNEWGQNWQTETVAELGGAVLLRLLGLDNHADLGGSWRYIQQYASEQGIEVVEACGRMLDRTCRAVALVLDSAEAIKKNALP
jgi:hypothetical protein